jgi:hypothetical protein
MNRIYLSVLISMLAVGCGKAAVKTHAAAPERATEKAVVHAEAAAAKPEEAPAKAEPITREVGDYVVYRFSGTYRSAPITLTERVVAREEGVLVLDVVLEEGRKKHELRLRTSDAPETRGEILSVARMRKGALTPMNIADYESLMAKTMLIADSNEALLGTEEISIALAGAKVPATQTSFRVKIDGRDATLRTVVSEKFPWGDVAGEITEGSDVLYRAEIVTIGHETADEKPQPPNEPVVAKSDYDEFE